MKRNRIIIFLLLLIVSIRMNAQHIYFVSVGIADYPGILNDLVLPVHDAQDLYDLYESNSNTTSVLLTDSVADKRRIMRECRKLFVKAGKNDIVILFFSGHGYPGGFVAHDGPFAYEEIRKLFSECKARNKMIFADACFSGDMRDGTVGEFKDPNNSIMLFLSSRGDEPSREYPKLRNGIFTTCLLRSLKGGADINKDRIITAKELFYAVSYGVKQLSQDKQHPVMWGSFDDDMPVMIWK